MLAEERFREILKIVKDKKTVTVQELTACCRLPNLRSAETLPHSISEGR